MFPTLLLINKDALVCLNFSYIANQILCRLASNNIMPAAVAIFKEEIAPFIGKDTNLSRFIYSLGIREVGEATAMNLALNFNNISKFLAADEQDFLEINDIGPVASNYIKEFLASDENINLVKDLIALGVNPKEMEVKNDNPFSSKSIVITGSFNNIARSQLKEELIRVGARVSSSVSSKTQYLIAGEKPGSKLKKATDLQITILDEEEALKLLNS